MKRRILIVGPRDVDKRGVYGGGAGGYTRNLSVYVLTLGSEKLYLEPFVHRVRGQSGPLGSNLLVRMLVDSVSFLITCLRRQPDAVHVLARYRTALPRELMQLFICRMLGIPFVYDVKAGAFESSYRKGNPIYRAMVKWVISRSSLLFAEGERTVNMLKSEFGRDCTFFPNFVPSREVPGSVTGLFAYNVIRLLFVGYCYPGKGVAALVDGARLAAASGLRLRLDLIGAESHEFIGWMDAQSGVDGLEIVRHGRLPHEGVLAAMKNADIYVYPTTHPGEGHNNSINEAMMNGLVIVTTRVGFLENVLAEDCGYFIDNVASADIAKALKLIVEDKTAAASTAVRARAKLIKEFTDDAAKVRFDVAYSHLFAHDMHSN